MATAPLQNRPGYEQADDSPLIRALRRLRRSAGKTAVILIDFDPERCGVTVSCEDQELGVAIQKVADRILTDLDDGYYDDCVGVKRH